jgi:fructose-bisphosphate aldolase class II
MTRTNSSRLVNAAKRQGTAVGAFNVILLEHAEALVSGAEVSNLPVILQVSENCVTYHGSLRPISLATLAVAEAASVAVSVHLDHAESEELVREALDLGYDSIMFDGSKLPYDENVATSARIAELCKSYGASLEVEIGEVGGKDGVHAPGVRTHPEEAKRFSESTGADLLAVAVGSSHAMTTRDATLDFELISEIASVVTVPLVLHGSSGVNDADLQKAVRGGMSKINIATHLNNVFTQDLRMFLEKNPAIIDPRKYISPARAGVSSEVARLLTLLNLKN